MENQYKTSISLDVHSRPRGPNRHAQNILADDNRMHCVLGLMDSLPHRPQARTQSRPQQTQEWKSTQMSALATVAQHRKPGTGGKLGNSQTWKSDNTLLDIQEGREIKRSTRGSQGNRSAAHRKRSETSKSSPKRGHSQQLTPPRREREDLKSKLNFTPRGDWKRNSLRP